MNNPGRRQVSDFLLLLLLLFLFERKSTSVSLAVIYTIILELKLSAQIETKENFKQLVVIIFFSNNNERFVRFISTAVLAQLGER